jgi:hypothetical protein
VISAHAGHSHGHALHLGFAIFCVLVVVFCVVAAHGPEGADARRATGGQAWTARRTSAVVRIPTIVPSVSTTRYSVAGVASR